MSYYVPEYVEHPDAYVAAIDRRIKQNAWTTRDRALRAEAPEIRDWLISRGTITGDQDPVTGEYERARSHPAGNPPAFLLDARDQWGGLTPRQLDFARRIYAERTDKAQARDSERSKRDAHRREHAAPWEEGRQEVTGALLSVRAEEVDVGYAGSTISLKGLLERADGALLWLSLGSAIADAGREAAEGDWPSYEDAARALRGATVRLRITVTPKDGDPTFGFGKRPTNGEVVALGSEGPE